MTESKRSEIELQAARDREAVAELRDRFAMAALSAARVDAHPTDMAVRAYTIADAMLKARL